MPKRGFHRSSGFSEDLGGLSDFDEIEEELDEEVSKWMRPDPTRTNQTFTNCTVLHPDDLSSLQTTLTSTYDGVQLSSGFDELSRSVSRMSSRPASSMSTRSSSVCEPGYRRAGALTFSSNIGLARVLNERHIGGHLTGSNMSLNNMSTVDGFSGGSSLTPSIISTPAGVRSLTPTRTPLNSPTHTPPGTPPNEKAEGGGGLVASFFSSLKSALYGEQQKEIQIKRRKSIRRPKMSFGILEKVEEVGVENLMSSSPAPSRESSISRSSSVEIGELESLASSKGSRRSKMPHTLSDFDLRFMHEHDMDELEDIRPGTLTRKKESGEYVQDPTIGQLNAPSFSMFGRPSMHPGELGRVPSPGFDAAAAGTSALGGGAFVGGRGPGRAVSAPGEKRPQLLGLLGIPGQPGTGALLAPPVDNRTASLRPDLGSVPMTKSPVDENAAGGFIGSMATMFFGRKGGLL